MLEFLLSSLYSLFYCGISIPWGKKMKHIFLKGPGYTILKLKLSGKKAPLIIDISKVNYKRTPGGKAFIVTSGLAKSLNVQMRSGCEITSIKPDTLFFSFNK